jgi:superfamily II DNA helicase RecQ
MGFLYRQEIPLAARLDVTRVSYHLPDSKPFTFNHKAETKKRYINIAKQLILYTLRCLSYAEAEVRPPFRVTDVIERAGKAVVDRGNEAAERWSAVKGDLSDQTMAEPMEKLKEATLSLFIALLGQPIKDSEHDSILVSFLAVLSVAPDGSWHGFETFTPWLSGIVSISRLFILREAYRIRQSEINANIELGSSLEKAMTVSTGIPRHVQKLTARLLVNDTPRCESMPMQYVFRLCNYGMTAKSNTASPGLISWKGSDLFFKGTQLSLSSLAILLQSTITSARRILYQDLLFQPFDPTEDTQPATVPPIPWARLQSHVSQDQVGFSVADSLFTAVPGSDNWLLSAITGRPDLKAKWYPSSCSSSLSSSSSTGPCPVPNVRVLSSYLKLVDRLLEHLLFLVHLTAGLPARSTEILTLRHTNTASGGLRNIFIDQDLVMIVLGIHKTLTKTQRLKIVHRFLPEEVGTILIHYLWLVVPFSTASLLNLPCNQDCVRSPFLWLTSGLGESDEVFQAKQVRSSNQLLDSFRVSKGFPVAKEKVLPTREDEDTPTIRAVDGRHVNPSTKPFTPTRMTRVIGRFGNTAGIDSLGISSWRHIAVAIGRRFIRDTSIVSQGHFSDATGEDSDSDASDQEVHGERETAVTLQTGHTARTNAMVYGRGINEYSFETSSRHSAFRELSKEWHFLLGMPSALRTVATFAVKGRKRTATSLDLDRFEQLQKSRFRQLRAIHLPSELSRLLGSRSSFREGQQAVLSCILRQEHPIVAVMPTGGGKSLLFQLPAAAHPSGVTIVVVPLVSLQGDLLEQTRKMNIPAAQWKSDQIVGDARLVFVTPETLFTKHFQTYLDILYSQALLDRIVIDECHTILEGSLDFRPRLSELGLLGRRDVQVVFLTATLPVAEESRFFKLIYSSPEAATFIRLPTTRANVGYTVRTFSLEEGTDDIAACKAAAVREVVDRVLVRYGGASKAIVYCSTRSETQSLADGLGCDAYYSDIGTDAEKARRLRSWMHDSRPGMYQNGRVIVATNALGLGINVPDIRLVLHLEMPRRIGDYGQQSGRAGRDGLPSEAVILRLEQRRRQQPGQGRGPGPGQPSDQISVDVKLDPSCRDFLRGGQCRRVALDRALDGRQDRQACEDGEERCDFCRSDLPASSAEGMSGHPTSSSSSSSGQGRGEEDSETRALRLRQLTTSLVRSTVSRQARDDQAEFDTFRALLSSELNKGCLFCRLLRVKASDHVPLACTHIKKGGREDVRLCFRQVSSLQHYYKRKKVVARYGACFSCFVPQELCNTWEEDLDGNWERVPGQACHFRGIILSAFTVAFQQQTGRVEQLLRDEGFQDTMPQPLAHERDQEKLRAWLGERVSWANVSSIRVCRVFGKLGEILQSVQ